MYFRRNRLRDWSKGKTKGESVFKLLTAKIYYKLLSYIVNDISLKDFSSGDFIALMASKTP